MIVINSGSSHVSVGDDVGDSDGDPVGLLVGLKVGKGVVGDDDGAVVVGWEGQKRKIGHVERYISILNVSVYTEPRI